MAIYEQIIPEWKEKALKQISENTLAEVLEKLNKNNRVLAVRPTGFGKSFLLAGLTSNTLPNGQYRFKKCLYVYPTSVIKKDVINSYGPCGKDERKDKLQNTTFISYMKLTNMINDLDNGKSTTVEGLELYPGIVDISSDGAWTGKPLSKTTDVIDSYQGQKGLRNWFKQFDLIMLDECHRAGSDGFLKTWDKIGSIITSSNNTKLVGVTATPDRLDDRSIKSIFGQSNQISRLTLSDCINPDKLRKMGIEVEGDNGLLSKFDYVYVIGDRERFLSTTIADINARRKRSGDSLLHEYEEQELLNEMNRIPLISDILQKSIKPENTGGSDYMKFVVFFRDKKHIETDGNKVKSWFEDAFPSLTCNVTNIVTKSAAGKVNYDISDVDALQELVPRDYTLDLIFCVDKLNMGYHVESITGVVLLRETNSAVMYNQQIGRCFSVRSMNKPIIFDIIDKCGAGTILDKTESNDEVSKGTKKELPSIIDKNCVDVHSFSQDFLTLSRDMRNQKYNYNKQIVDFLYNNRQAPVEIISEILGINLADLDIIIKEVARD